MNTSTLPFHSLCSAAIWSMPSSVISAVKREMPFHDQKAAPLSCITISGLPCRVTASSNAAITKSARSAPSSATPCPTT